MTSTNIIVKKKTNNIAGAIGKKLGMSTFISPSGEAFGVSVLEIGPCEVVQVKTTEKDGYQAAQIGFGQVRQINKAEAGHLKKHQVQSTPRVLKEFPVMGPVEVGEFVTVENFKEGEIVDVFAISKGKGWCGVVKRWGFAGGHKTHGGNVHRAPGSVASGTFPSEVWKGKKMPGRMGNKRVTVQNLTIVKVLPEENALIIKGAVPGHRNAILFVKKAAKPARKAATSK